MKLTPLAKPYLQKMKKVKVELDYDIGDKVYIVTDPQQLARQVVYIIMYKQSAIYGVRCSEFEASEHQAFELSDSPDLMNVGKDIEE